MKTKAELIQEAMKWANKATVAIEDAGGSSPFVLNMFPPDLLEVLVCNHIDLIYTGSRKN
jgi:hypothetical protein